MFDQKTVQTLTEFALYNGYQPAELLAVCVIESGGRVFAAIEGKDEPLIRFEGHYFYRLLGTAKRNRAVVKGLANRRAGKVANPRSQQRRWKLLDRAMAIDHTAALQSTSWGLGQVMGIHWRWLEYASPDAMVSRARSGVEGQAELMVRYIEKAGLSEMIRLGDWRGFARGYNGPAYARYKYHIRLEAAYNRYAGYPRKRMERFAPLRADASLTRNSPLLLKMGCTGASVRELQRSLRQSGIQVVVDGDFGPATRRAVMAFQLREKLVADGIAGPVTFEHLSRQSMAYRP